MPVEVSGTIGHFRVVRRIGSGGMGLVCLGEDLLLRRSVALKFILGDSATNEDSRARFLREARTAASLSHPNVCTIFETGTTASGGGGTLVGDLRIEGGTPFIAMELLEGCSLAEILRKRAPLDPDEAIRIARQIAEGLAAAHRRHITHRDLKPTNVFVTTDGVVKILDFGLAKWTEGPPASEDSPTAVMSARLTKPGTVLGTVDYMSPEQVRGEPVDARSDVFSFGVLLYEMVTGRRAFANPSSAAVMASILRDEPAIPAGIPQTLRALIERCLRKSPEGRFANADELAAELRRVDEPKCEARPSIAVLPFRMLSADEDDAYFGEGLAEELINVLTRSTELRVIARTSAFAFRGREIDVREIASALGVEHVLEGSIRRFGRKVRVNVQLVAARDGSEVWGERYERELTDVFALQDEISGAIAQQLRGQLSSGAPPAGARSRISDMEAYDLYLRGRASMHRWTPEGIQSGRELLDAAIARAPDLALAWDSMAELYWFLGFFAILPPREAFSASSRAVRRAIEIDDTLPEAHALLGMLRKELDYDWPGVEEEFARARALSPESPTVRLRYTLSQLMPHGRLAEAIEEMNAVVEADPLAPFERWWLGVYHMLARDYAAAVRQGLAIVGLDPTYHLGHLVLAFGLVGLGESERATAEFELAAEYSGGAPVFHGFLGWAYAVTGRTRDARRILDGLRDPSRPGWTPPTSLAWIHLGLGEIDQAFGEMERAIDERDPIIMPILTYPHLDPVRSDPRFATLLKKMKLS